MRNNVKLTMMIIAVIQLSVFLTGCIVKEHDKNLKIAIIGAGASGLTAGYTLKKNGYNNVTIFEREKEVGGKVYSYEYGGRIYEIGAAVFDDTDYPTIVELAEKYNVPYFINDTIRLLGSEPHEETCSILDRAGNCIPIELPLDETLKLIGISIANTYFTEPPGFIGALPSVTKTASDFMAQYGLTTIDSFLKRYSVAYGYGYFQEVPMMYYLKYGKMLNDGIANLCQFRYGWQSLWKAVANDLNVQLSSEVTNVKRYREDGKPKVEITLNNDASTTQVFDRVIISSHLESTHQFLDLTDTESSLFNKIVNYEYYVTLIKLKKNLDLPENIARSFNILEHLENDYKGHVLIGTIEDTDEKIYRFYQLNDWTMDNDEMFNLMQEDIELFGGEVYTEALDNGIILQKRWKYFPHVKSDDITNDFYLNLEKLQGKNGTYYIGAIMNFETVELTAQYAKHLMIKYF